MNDPVLHLLVGPNGAGKTTLYERIVGPATGLPFVNADRIAAERFPEDPEGRSYDAARLAAAIRAGRIAARESFVAETVFSHPSKLDVIRTARAEGFLVALHVVLVPEALSVARVASRVRHGGHAVPEHKIRERHRRLWPIVAEAISMVDQATVYDNCAAARPFDVVATFERGVARRQPSWPTWAPEALRRL